MRVKICGITNLDDALDAIQFGAHALGFVFYEKSPRYITPTACKNIIDSLPPFVEKVGLFVNEDAQTINAIARKSGITLAQLHYDAPQETIDALEIAYIRVVRAKSAQDIRRFSDSYRIVDAFVPEYGGMGKRLNTQWFEGVDTSRIILAGGLTPQNVASLASMNLYGVDVSSGVEKSLGKKDKKKVESFIKNALL